MQKNLVIVESPAKAKTIGRFLGKDYKVMPSFGHIRDLKSKSFSIDTETFSPQYEIPEDKRQIVNTLRSEAKDSVVWLASDEDREGEAISWHLAEVLHLDVKTTRRIVFHEITQTAIQDAILHPRTINLDLVNAQQARRVLDRIVGFKLSPVLWRKVRPSLSAGRVQSVAVRLVCDREKEIEQFEATPYFSVSATFCCEMADGTSSIFKADLNKQFATEDEARAFLQDCSGAQFWVENIECKPVKHTPAPPFMTSTLQQEAAHKLGYSVTQTMRIAQSLYEAGHITYMRTDSLNLSSLCLESSRKFIEENYGKQYAKRRNFQTKSKGAQEAHEAIRPTYMDVEDIPGTSSEKRLYQLIRRRTLACQMAEAVFEKTVATVSISNRKEKFVATGEILQFDGFLKVYQSSSDNEKATAKNNTMLPPLKETSQLVYNDIVVAQKFTQRPARYNEAALVKKMEELGIGRPSTYAPIISTIQQRGYVEKTTKEGNVRKCLVITLGANGKTKEVEKKENYGTEKGKLLPTDVGMVVNEFLKQEFPDILDYNFTAKVEKDFDSIAEGKKEWSEVMKEFYEEFIPEVEKAMDSKSEHKIGERVLGTDPQTGRVVAAKIGRFGTMVQLGTADELEKPLFAPLLKGQTIDSITLEEALDLLRLPRILGEFEGDKVVVNNGRFGPYVLNNGKYYSIPKEMNLMTITWEEAVKLVQEKRADDAARHIKSFDEDPELLILNGRYGPYISCQKKNYHLPKNLSKAPEDLSYEECKKIIAEQQSKGSTAKKTTRRSRKS